MGAHAEVPLVAFPEANALEVTQAVFALGQARLGNQRGIRLAARQLADYAASTL